MRAFFVLVAVFVSAWVVTPADAASLYGPRIELLRGTPVDELRVNDATLDTSVDLTRVRMVCDDLNPRFDEPPADSHDEVPCSAPSLSGNDEEVAAYCDERGATMLAPPRIRPIADGKIEATPLCLRDLLASLSASAHLDEGRGGKQPPAPLFQPLDPASLVPVFEPPVASYVRTSWRRIMDDSTGKDHPRRRDRPPTR
jgi:hypothetical protein